MVLQCYLPESFIFGSIFYHGFRGLHGWEARLFLSVKSVKSVVEFLWLRLAALGLLRFLAAIPSVAFDRQIQPLAFSL